MFDFGTPIQNHFLAYRKLLGMVNPDIMFSPFRSCLCVVFSLGSLGTLKSNVGKTMRNHPPVITIFVGVMEIPVPVMGGKNDIVLTT